MFLKLITNLYCTACAHETTSHVLESMSKGGQFVDKARISDVVSWTQAIRK